jgi:hypothetical protein
VRASPRAGTINADDAGKATAPAPAAQEMISADDGRVVERRGAPKMTAE